MVGRVGNYLAEFGWMLLWNGRDHHARGARISDDKTHRTGHYFKGGQRRNRTTDTRIFSQSENKTKKTHRD